MVEKLSTLGVVLAIAIETVLAAEDVYRLYQMSEEGRISDKEFVDAIKHRIYTACGSITGSCLGTAVGSAFGLPGSFLGGAIGNYIGGKICGRAFSPPKQFF